jgi:adenine-specific DNA-methyltransferase
MQNLAKAKRFYPEGNNLSYIQYLNDFPMKKLTNMWGDTTGASNKIYVVQTAEKPMQRCLLMTTDPGDLAFDPTCGSGTTAYVAEQWGRRWITCDTSRVAVTLAKQRLMTAVFDYYELAHQSEGVGSGFKYKTVPHVTLKSIANNEPPGEETLYDQPLTDNSKARVTGPFTVEAVPAQAVKSLDDIEERPASDLSVTRSGETLRQSQWRDELFKTGIRGKGGQRIEFSRVEPFGGTRWLHCDAETKEAKPQRVVVSFGPEYAPLEQRQVELAIQEAQTLVPKPKIVVFAAFEFDPEAAKDIDELNWPGVNLIKVKMNADLLTDDLKKKRSSNESFWLIGQPDIRLSELTKKELADLNSKLNTKHSKLYRIAVLGFDYYNTITGNIESGGTEKIAMWMLDTDYDERSLFPKQVFFPMAGESEGWTKLAKNLKAEIDEELIESYRGTVSLPFEAGESKKAAIKIIDDRGIESLKIIGI